MAQRIKIRKICKFCEKEFLVSKCRINQIFCDKNCYKQCFQKLGFKGMHKEDCKCSFCFKEGKHNPNYNHKWSDKKKEEYSKQRTGIGNPMYGKTYTKPQNSIKSGSDCSFWIDGRTSLTNMIRNLKEMKDWRNSVFKRDNYICQECFSRNCYLEAHHIIDFCQILSNFLLQYSQFSPIEDKEILIRLVITHEPFWDINNGKTLCRKCHDRTKKSKRKTNGKI